MKIILCAFLAGTVALSSAASAGKLCDDKPGSARTRCLEAERERGQRELDEINRKNKNLDRAIATTCAARSVGSAAAGGVGAAVAASNGQSPVLGNIAGKATFNGSAAAGDYALGNSSPCTPRAR